ncbi:hypothetical protein PFFVO_04373 [Plasmodium falciparum Vietnam Oak-Knoll (FVO)]|uniref:Uncharacterized protein n=1 Tax=Plasmodium falciparum Vietnam Oak-Knoll (FVO) TaxID=1036723 RepID=A0A024V1N6_PLAFA|nr:hypothetical protein PFFVO_04373 [Plasmodium falciparum Vietnam Oak-Knoll (FVO)]
MKGLSTLENYSLSIEESYACQRTDDEKKYINDMKLKEIFNFLILIEEFNPFDYSNQRLEYSFKFSKSSLSNILQKTNRTNIYLYIYIYFFFFFFEIRLIIK